MGVVDEGHGADPAAAGEGFTAEVAIDAGIDATAGVTHANDGPTLPSVTAPIGVATTGAASPSLRRDRDRDRRPSRTHDVGTPATPPTAPVTAPAIAPTPPPTRPACKLDEYGVPLERC